MYKEAENVKMNVDGRYDDAVVYNDNVEASKVAVGLENLVKLVIVRKPCLSDVAIMLGVFSHANNHAPNFMHINYNHSKNKARRQLMIVP